MEFDITIWVVEQISFKLASRRYDIEQSEGYTKKCQKQN